jgi:hypothetical protein
MSSSSRENQQKIIRKSREKIKGEEGGCFNKKTHHHQTAEAAATAPEAKIQKQKQKHQGEKRREEKGQRKDCYLRRPMMGRKQHPVQQHLSVWNLQTKRTEPTTEQSCKNKTRKGWRENSFSVRANCERKTTRMRAAEETIYIDRVGKGKCKRRSCCCCCCKSLKQTCCANQERRRMGEREREREREKVGSNLLWWCPGAVKRVGA